MNENLYGRPLAALEGKRVRRSPNRNWMVTGFELGILLVPWKHGLFSSIYVDDIKISEEKQTMGPMCKKLMKNVDLEDPTSFLDNEYLECTQRECKTNEIIFEKYTKKVWITSFCSSNWKVTRLGEVSRKDSCVVLRHGRTCAKYVERRRVLTRKRQRLCKVSTLVLIITTSRSRSLKRLESCPMYVLRLSCNACTWHEFVDVTLRSVTKWTGACDTRLALLISHIHHVSDFRQES